VGEVVMEETLPTVSGFFFGGTEYDEWYYDSLGYTIDTIKDALIGVEDENYGVTFHYESSW